MSGACPNPPGPPADSLTHQGARPLRRYQAMAVECPRCGAGPGARCWRPGVVGGSYAGVDMRGVHRERDVEFNHQAVRDAR